MKSKLMITALCLMLMSGGYVLAHEGDNDGDEASDSMMAPGAMGQGSMMEDQGMMPEAGQAMESQAVEAGNTICPVEGGPTPAAGEKGPMGEAVKYEYNGKIYNLCCAMCVKEFEKDPEKYSKMADEQAQEK